ncbi:membrane protein insertion efficiency factor YidD [Nesterenkonia muleiensis]|uniref:membrane protein insertion efficiency factor YidD n=1 Tax=Nesterenkonia muleiensis TaxID=2282648 RepID=UPI000E7693C3
MTWIRHSDFYLEEFLSASPPPPEDSAASGTRGGHGVSPSPEQARNYWHWWRRAPSYPLIWFILFWRKMISPLYGEVCGFYPSCSAYGLEAVTVHGLVRGSVLTGWRILRCNPFTGGGVDHIPASSRVWPEQELPPIVKLNHPPIPRDPD